MLKKLLVVSTYKECLKKYLLFKETNLKKYNKCCNYP